MTERQAFLGDSKLYKAARRSLPLILLALTAGYSFKAMGWFHVSVHYGWLVFVPATIALLAHRASSNDPNKASL